MGGFPVLALSCSVKLWGVGGCRFPMSAGPPGFDLTIHGDDRDNVCLLPSLPKELYSLVGV